MAISHSGKTDNSSYITPPPSSLCPICQQCEVDAIHYPRGAAEEIIYSCDNRHTWLVRWLEVTE